MPAERETRVRRRSGQEMTAQRRHSGTLVSHEATAERERDRKKKSRLTPPALLLLAMVHMCLSAGAGRATSASLASLRPSISSVPDFHRREIVYDLLELGILVWVFGCGWRGEARG